MLSRSIGYFYYLTFIFLSIVALKISFIRVGQLFLLILFLLILSQDIKDKKVDIFILVYFFVGAVLMILISLNSTYPKIAQTKYFLKYLVIFPAAFYIGAKMLYLLGVKRVILLLESMAFFYMLVSFLVYFHILPDSLDFLLSYRVGFQGELYLEFQGTFDEAGTLAQIVYLLVLISLGLRYEYKIWPKKQKIFFLFILYSFILIGLVLTKNKTIWISLIFTLLFLIFFKILFLLLYSNYYKPKYKIKNDEVLSKFINLNSIKIFLAIFFIVGLFVFVNEILPEPIITTQMIHKKLSQERGKAFLYAIDLLKNSNWIGGYGFGFIEYYFTNLPTKIIGLGKGVGMIFNSYLDLWISVSFVGVLFHFILLYISFSKKYFFSMIVPITIFIYNNFNPFIADEFNYIFLGISYGFVQMCVLKKKEYLREEVEDSCYRCPY